jgi:hypothetical protein
LSDFLYKIYQAYNHSRFYHLRKLERSKYLSSIEEQTRLRIEHLENEIEKCNERIGKKECNINDVRYFLKWITQLFYEYHRKKVFIIIDNYDYHLTCDCIVEIGHKLQANCILKTMIEGSLVNNDCIEKVIFCGATKLNDYFFSGLDIEYYCYPNHSKLYKYFCLTEDELVEYINQHRLNVRCQR